MARYGGLSVLDLKRMKKLDAENAKLKKMYAELPIENEAIRRSTIEGCNAVGAPGSSTRYSP